eukprot:COSAG01_NODE_1704_length_9434_cov_159.120193_2_plen_683_part_00
MNNANARLSTGLNVVRLAAWLVAAALALLAGLQPAPVDAAICGDNDETNTFPPLILPPPKKLTYTSYALQCADNAPGTCYENTAYSDGNGPRGAHNASECCSICASNDGCSFWSFNEDSSIEGPPGLCKWGRLKSCCFLHSSGTNLKTLAPSASSVQFGAKGSWASGAIKPTAAAPALGGDIGSHVGPLKSELVLSSGTRISTSSRALLPLAALLSDDIFRISGIRMNASEAPAPAQAGEISFSLRGSGWAGQPHTDPQAEHYSVTVDGRGAAVSCYSYTGCAWGATTLLQSLCVSGVALQVAAFPAFNISDFPDIPYRGMLVDTARASVTARELMEAANTARFMKVRYLHLHLTDDHAWTFPSTAFPELGSDNIGFRGPTPQKYTVAELEQVVAYADARGVTVIPELEGPGHSSAMRRSAPAFNGAGGDSPQGGGVINAANQSVYDGMATIVQEMSSIFKSSPYIHVGCDETSTPPTLPGYKDFAPKHNISGGSDLFAYYVKTMADAVKSNGKQAMIWGPAAMQRLEPGDAVVMVWQGSDGVAAEAESHGLEWINCPNGGGNISQEFERSVLDFGNSPDPSFRPHHLNMSSPGLHGVQVNMWERGWAHMHTEPARPATSGTATYVDQALSRAAGAGWWGRSWPRNASATVGVPNGTSWEHAYQYGKYVMSRLQPQCEPDKR